MIGYHTKGHTHSTYANVPHLKEANPDQIWINPIDAKKRNIKHGDIIQVYNDRGILQLLAKITQRIIPSVIAIPQGAWYKSNAKVLILVVA